VRKDESVGHIRPLCHFEANGREIPAEQQLKRDLLAEIDLLTSEI
jgi:hypothetical protein